MKTQLIILGSLLGVFVAVALYQGKFVDGVKESGNLLYSIIPILLLAFAVAGFMQVVIPQEMISKWMGGESGLKGIMIGSAAGAITPGGPFIAFPIAAGLREQGAGLGPVIAYICGWLMWGLTRLPYEFTYLGTRLAIIRFLITLPFPIIAGFMAVLVEKKFGSL